MKFIVERKNLLPSLKKINNLLISKPSSIILSNILLKIKKNYLLLTSSNLESEITTRVIITKIFQNGEITVPALKFYNICRSLPEESIISIEIKQHSMIISSGLCKFIISTLPALNFPLLDTCKKKVYFYISQKIFKEIIELTKFSMASKDFRYYLNGMFLEIIDKKLTVVTTDAYRLSIYSMNLKKDMPYISVIIPKNSISELFKILNNNEEPIKLEIGDNNIRAITNNYVFTSKLIDGKFPNYSLVIDQNGLQKKTLEVSSTVLKQALTRVAILSNEKFNNIKFYIKKNSLKISSDNYNQEKAEEILDVIYSSEEMEMNFNVNYFLDILNTLKSNYLKIFMTDKISSIKIENDTNKSIIYIIMPIKL